MHYYNEKLEKQKFEIIKSPTIINNHKRMEAAALDVRDHIVSYLRLPEGDKNTTWRYRQYNMFTISMEVAPRLFGELWRELVKVIQDNSPPQAKMAWVQSWLNYDTADTVEGNLKYHAHNSPLHGYIAISPQDTKTVFDDFEVKNEIGNIYVGLGKWMHHVENTSKYSGPRITIGYDVVFGDDVGEGWAFQPAYQSLPWHAHWIPIPLD